MTNHNIGNNSIQDLIIYKKAEKIINSNIDLLQFFIINKVEFKIEKNKNKLNTKTVCIILNSAAKYLLFLSHCGFPLNKSGNVFSIL